MKGGADTNAIWDQFIKQSTFKERLDHDPSLERFNLLTTEHKPNYVSIKERLIETDPTNNKQHFRWILTGYQDGGNHLLEDVLTHMKTSLKEFTTLKQQGHLTDLEKDLFMLCGLFGCVRHNQRTDGLLGLLEKHRKISPIVSSKEQERQIRKDAELVYQDENITIIHPKTKEASILYGKGTRWCTSAQESENMFEEYNKEGNLYIILPKHPQRTGEKYQLHIESRSFMDELDNPIRIEDIQDYEQSIINFLKTLDLNKPREYNIGGKMIKSYPLHRQVYVPHRENATIVKLLLSAGSDPSLLDGENHNFYYYLNPKKSRLLFILLDAGMKVNKSDLKFLTKFLFQTHHISIKQLNLLFNAGVDPNTRDQRGYTILQYVDEDVLPFLLKKVQYQQQDLDNLLFSNGFAQSIPLLIKLGANINAVNGQGNTPLESQLIYHLNIDIIMAIIRSGGKAPKHTLNEIGIIIGLDNFIKLIDEKHIIIENYDDFKNLMEVFWGEIFYPSKKHDPIEMRLIMIYMKELLKTPVGQKYLEGIETDPLVERLGVYRVKQTLQQLSDRK
jgi:hypothetical protein